MPVTHGHERFSRIRKVIFEVLLWSAAAGVLIMNVVLLRQNRTLRVVAASSKNMTADGIQPGAHLGRLLAAATLDNGHRPIAFPTPDSRKVLIITFSPGCPHCEANQKNWSVITSELRRRGEWHILWVSRDPVAFTKDYCEDHNMPFSETLADPTYRTYLALNLRQVPNTIAVDSKGVVEKVWGGELHSPQWAQVFDYFQVAYTPVSAKAD
jgi:peroxiredoxin